MLNKGDTCYVKWHSGEIVKGEYIRKSTVPKSYWIDTKKGKLFATPSPEEFHECRFVCMSGMRKEYVESLS